MDIVKLNIPDAERWTDDYLFQFCMANSDLNIERDDLGTIYIMSPVGAISSFYSGELAHEIKSWNRKAKLGITFDSSVGYFLPDGSMKSPDASWLSSEKWNSISAKEKNKFPHTCPEVIVEVKSNSDRMPPLKKKMESWIQNGVLLGWLVDPKTKKVWVYSPNHPTGQLLPETGQLDGGDVLPGFSYSLEDLFSQV